MYFPKVIIQSSEVYQRILSEMCSHDRLNCPSDCGNCIVRNHVEGTKWLKSMGININVVWHGSVLPDRLSQWIISRRIKKVYRGYTHPFWIVYSVILTGITLVGVLHHFILTN